MLFVKYIVFNFQLFFVNQPTWGSHLFLSSSSCLSKFFCHHSHSPFAKLGPGVEVVILLYSFFQDLQAHLIININIESWNLFRIKLDRFFYRTFTQQPNILICKDRGTVSQRPLGEALAYHANLFAFPDQSLSSWFGGVIESSWHSSDSVFAFQICSFWGSPLMGKQGGVGGENLSQDNL